MKKYLAAAVVALMVFAFSAFAASLNVGNSILAAGEGDVTACNDADLNVVSWGAEVDDFTVNNVSFDPAGLEGCGDDEVIFVQAHDDDGDEVGRSGELRVGDLSATATRVTVPFQEPVNIEDVYALRVVVHTKTG